jgi:hypothetical protein
MIVYIVLATEDDYESSHSWISGVYADEATAEKVADVLNAESTSAYYEVHEKEVV